MKKTLLSLIAATAVGFTLCIATPGHAAGSHKTEQALLKLEHEWADAYVRKDVAALDRIEADDYTLTDPTGKMATKKQDIEDVKSGVFKAESISFEDTQVRIYRKTAVITGVATMKATYKQQDISGKYRFTDVLVKHKGGWKAVATQFTAVASGK